MSILDALRRQLLGQAAMMRPGQGMGGATQGLFGQGGQMGGGLLQSNLSQMNQGEGGLLSNIPQAAILGSAIYGQGVQGKDPFSALLPAVAQTAQIKNLMTPKVGALKQAYDPQQKKVVYATDVEIRNKNLQPALPTKNIVQTPGGGLSITESYGEGGLVGNQKSIDTANEILSTRNAMNNVAENLYQNLKGAKTGLVGLSIQTLDDIGSQAKQAADSFGFAQNYDDKGTGAIDKVMTEKFNISKEATNYGKIKSAAINLAYLVARIDEPGGRFTDRDIALKMEEFGFGANPERTIEIMKNAIDLRNKNAEQQYQILTGGVSMPSIETELEKEKKKLNKKTNPFDLDL